MRLKSIFFLALIVAVGYFGMHYLIGNEGGDYTVVNPISSNMGSQMKQSYESFEGTKYRTIAILAGKVFHLEAKIKTTSGDLNLSFIDPNGKILYSVSTPEEPIEIDILIPLNGEYRLQVEGEHQGSYVLNWDVRSADKLQE